MSKIYSLLPINNTCIDNKSLFYYFDNSWDLSEKLYGSIKEEFLYCNPDKLRYPLIFYYAHTAVFYINILVKAGLIKNRINDEFEKMFASGVDPVVPEELPNNITWPNLVEVLNYRKKAYEMISEVIAKSNLEHLSPFSPAWAILMGIDHDRIHFETSSVLIKQYPVYALDKPLGWTYAPVDTHYNGTNFVEIEGGNVSFGKPLSYPYFGWDNEYGFAKYQLNNFKVSTTLIANLDFLRFVQDDGYNTRKLWSDEGWQWKIANSVKYPKFWIKADDIYKYRAMYDELDMPNSWPVEVNFYEAEAYCKWAGNSGRMMSEAEFELMAERFGPKDEPFLNERCNINLKFGSPTPVNFFSDKVIHDVYGNVFQWLSTSFYPLPAFTTHYLYQNFSYPYFDSEHYMLKGGSWASSGASASKYYRLWFRKHFFQHAGFRICR